MFYRQVAALSTTSSLPELQQNQDKAHCHACKQAAQKDRIQTTYLREEVSVLSEDTDFS